MSLIERQSRLLNDCIDSVKIWQTLIDENLTNNEKNTAKELLTEVTKSYCSVHSETKKYDNALKKIEDHMNENQEIDSMDPEAMFENFVAADNTNCNHFNSEIWKAVFRGQSTHDVEEVQQIREVFNESNFQALDESLQFSEVFSLPVDPFTKQTITDPYKNRNCGHVYEYKFIVQYIKSLKNRAKCPYVGCGNRHLSMNDLVKDDALQRKIIEHSQQSNQLSD